MDSRVGSLVTVLIQSTMTGTPLRSHFSMRGNLARSMIRARSPSRSAPIARFRPVVPLAGVALHAVAITLSNFLTPKYASTILRHAGPHIPLPCGKCFVSSLNPDAPMRLIGPRKRTAIRHFPEQHGHSCQGRVSNPLRDCIQRFVAVSFIVLIEN